MKRWRSGSRRPIASTAFSLALTLVCAEGRGVELPSGPHAVPAPGSLLGQQPPPVSQQLFPKAALPKAPAGFARPFEVGPGVVPAPGQLQPGGPTAGAGGAQSKIVGPGSKPAIVGRDSRPAPAVRGPGSETAGGSLNLPALGQAVANQVASSISDLLPDPAPLVVGIVYRGGNGGSDYEICTGTIVDSTHILTAGHCACGLPTSYRIYLSESIYPDGIKTIDGGLGTIFLNTKPPIMFDSGLCQAGQIDRSAYGKDLALLELAAGASIGVPAINFGDPIGALLSELVNGQKLLVMGYGYNNQNLIGFRNKDAIPIRSVASMEPTLAPYCKSFAEMILGQSPGPTARDDTCGGDSGGPVFYTANGGYVLIAVTSRSAPGVQDNPGNNCGGGGIYTILGRDSVQLWLSANGVKAASWTKSPPVSQK
jgi:hypothetical protein